MTNLGFFKKARISVIAAALSIFALNEFYKNSADMNDMRDNTLEIRKGEGFFGYRGLMREYHNNSNNNDIWCETIDLQGKISFEASDCTSYGRPLDGRVDIIYSEQMPDISGQERIAAYHLNPDLWDKADLELAKTKEMFKQELFELEKKRLMALRQYELWPVQ